MFTSSEFNVLIKEYSVVVLPEPVGPEVSTIPFGKEIRYSIFFLSSGEIPSILISLSLFVSVIAGARILITIFSLLPTGNVFTRKSC